MYAIGQVAGTPMRPLVVCAELFIKIRIKLQLIKFLIAHLSESFNAVKRC